MTTTNKVPNRLAKEKSPYLLQHANNPVDWHPWGEEAFSKAKEEDKPIFLSIGYSTCHWCHVMERESFEDEEVAAALNKDFISIKVDREERPDVDHLYMSFCQAMTGHGGWPLTVIMTAEKKPFFTGTYFPKNSKRGMPGLLEILPEVNRLWQQEREELLRTGEELTQALRQENSTAGGGEISPLLVEQGYEILSRSYDPHYGGFGAAPKFPTPHNTTFLLRYGGTKQNKTALAMAENTLEWMYRGGIFDHLGFGFSRYSTDRQWLVPHFEKMLYDNALLTVAYTEAYQATGKELFRQVTELIIKYVLRDLTSPEGAFYSAEDADSEGIEGKFYVWSYEDVEIILGSDAAQKFCSRYDISREGNFEGESIPNLSKTDLAQLAGEDSTLLEQYREKLFTVRDKRIHPYKDDKILTAWNGQMIAALAIAGKVLGKREYLEAAEQAVDFISNHLTQPDGRLLARYREGEAAYPGYLDDYAFLTWGLVELYQATFQPRYLQLAFQLTNITLEDFWDEQNKGFFMTGKQGEQLLIRPKEIYDGAMPSGNSIMAMNLLRLAELTGETQLKIKAQELLQAFTGVASKYPAGYTALLQAIQFSQEPIRQVVIVDPLGSGAKEMRQLLSQQFLPFTIVHYLTPDHEELYQKMPFLRDYKAQEDKVTVYVCQNYSCQAPLTDPLVLANMLTTD